MDLDQKVLVTSVMNSVVEELWKREELPDTLTVAEFGDQFEIHFEAPKLLESLVEINRIQTL